jgi:hypothetical protein
MTDRRAPLDANDKAAVLSLARSLVKDATVILKDFSVIHAQPNSDVVVLYCWHDKQTVLASIPTVHLKVYFRRERLTGKEANLVVDRNLDSFAYHFCEI